MRCLIVIITTVSFVLAHYSDLTYLAAFGYLDIEVGDGEHAPLISIPDDTKSSAVKKFQKYYGLPVTGIIDKDTHQRMTEPRCGVPDEDADDTVIGDVKGGKRGKGKKKKKKQKRYAVATRKWLKTKLSYRFMNYTSDIPLHLTRAAFKEAFNLWEEASALEFLEETKKSVKADIEISYISGVHSDKSPFNKIVLGHAFFPTFGWLHMNDLQDWNYRSRRGTDTVYVALHELGHVLGLKHSRINTVMHASYPGYTPELKLSTDDKNGIQSLYGRNPCIPNTCMNHGVCRKLEGGKSACTCASGYKGSRCQTDSRKSILQCRELKNIIRNSIVYPQGKINPNQKVSVSCRSGYDISGASQFTCTNRGIYVPNPRTASCRRKVYCPSIQITNGSTYPRSGAVPSTVVSFRCDDGYHISGALKIKCRSDGTYDRPPPTCTKFNKKTDEDDVMCPSEFDALVSRTQTDRLIFAFKGSRYWVYKKGSTGAPESHYLSSRDKGRAFSNIPDNLDAAFSLTSRDNKRYMCFVKWPKVYYMDIISRKIVRIGNFPTIFKITQQITAAYRFDRDNIHFFVPSGYYVYNMKEEKLQTRYLQHMSTFLGMPYRTTITAASKSFYIGLFYLFAKEEVYLIRSRDKQVVAPSPLKVSTTWRHGLDTCS